MKIEISTYNFLPQKDDFLMWQFDILPTLVVVKQYNEMENRKYTVISISWLFWGISFITAGKYLGDDFYLMDD